MNLEILVEALMEFSVEIPKPSETKGMHRDNMPQVEKKDYPAFVSYLKSNKVTLTNKTVDPDILKPVQKNFNKKQVEQIVGFMKTHKEMKPIIVSKDNYIIDGHHRWLAVKNVGGKMPILQASVNFNRLFDLINDFPKTIYKDSTTNKVIGTATMKEDTISDYKGGVQKDWIVYNSDLTKLFCIAIVNDGEKWKLIEFVNIFGNKDKILETVTMGYDTMLSASLGREGYDYIIAYHSFEKKDIDTDYWHNMISDAKFWDKESLSKDIDINEFEKEMSKLVKEKDILYKNSTIKGKVMKEDSNLVYAISLFINEAKTYDKGLSPAQIEALRTEYAKIKKIDPDSAVYRKMIGMLDTMKVSNKDMLRQISTANIPWLSKLALNRVKNPSVIATKPTGKIFKEEKDMKKDLDPVDKKELKGKFKDRDDKDIDNDGEVDDQDEYIHNKRKTISKKVEESVVDRAARLLDELDIPEKDKLV